MLAGSRQEDACVLWRSVEDNNTARSYSVEATSVLAGSRQEDACVLWRRYSARVNVYGMVLLKLTPRAQVLTRRFIVSSRYVSKYAGCVFRRATWREQQNENA